jgi:hypothetical protein
MHIANDSLQIRDNMRGLADVFNKAQTADKKGSKVNQK